MSSEKAADLPDKESPEGDVSAGLVRKRHRDNIRQPLSLVNDGVGVRQVFPIIDTDLTTSYYLLQLLVDLLCTHKRKKCLSLHSFERINKCHINF